MQGAKHRHPQLPGDRLDHAVGRDLRPDDRKDARRQHLRRRLGRQGRRYDRRLDRRSDDEGRAEEPVVGTAAAEATPEEIIVEGATAHLASECEGTHRGRAAVGRLHHRNAIRHRLGAGAARIGNAQEGIAGRAAAVDDELVRGRAVARQKGVHRDRSASPDVAGRRQVRTGRSPRAHVHQAGIVDARYGLTEPIEIECSAARDRHRRIWAEQVWRTGPQGAREHIRRSAVAVGTYECGGAGEHIDGAIAADCRCKKIVGRCVIEVDRAGASAKCDARRAQRAGCDRRAARAGANVESSGRAGVRRDRNGRRGNNAAFRDGERARAQIANVHRRNVDPAGARAGYCRRTVRTGALADVGSGAGDIGDHPTVCDNERARAKTADIEPIEPE